MPDTGEQMEESDGLEELIRFLKEERGFDFGGYKRASLRRRIDKRMGEVGVADYAAYVDHLQVRPEEFTRLFNTILINVTAFFRDADHWQYLAEEIVPRILESTPSDAPIRVWSAGCSSGEEAYTLAMVLTEAIGRTELRQRVKIYATDIDEEALTQARQATYQARDVEAVPEHLRHRYFQPQGDRFAFDADLRRSVIFGRHDLVTDAPIGKLDLLVCRNVLMYFNAERQAQVLRNLHFALNPRGFLFLGKAEMILSRTDLFEPVDLRYRVFAKTDADPRELRLGPRVAVGRNSAPPPGGEDANQRDAAFAAGPVPQVVISLEGTLSMANNAARAVFGISAHDIGRPLKDLELSYRPIELRSRIETAVRERRAVQVSGLQHQVGPEQTRHYDIHITPLNSGTGRMLGVSITFTDVSRYQQMHAKLQQSGQELETAFEELQSSNEELETTNEELQSANEELETTNEELQSANEELETMNEELQSANTELQELNHELTIRSGQLDQSQTFLSSILSSITLGVTVVDDDFEVLVWSDGAFDLWGLREDEVVGRSLSSLDIGLPVGELSQPVRQVLAGAEEVTMQVPAINRRGKQITCRVVCAPLHIRDGDSSGVVITMEPL